MLSNNLGRNIKHCQNLLNVGILLAWMVHFKYHMLTIDSRCQLQTMTNQKFIVNNFDFHKLNCL